MAFFYFSKWAGSDCLTIVFTMDFLLDEQEYNCVVYARKGSSEQTTYAITILSEEGAEVLSHPFTLVEKESVLSKAPLHPDDPFALIKQASAIALEIYLSQKRSAHEMTERYIA